MQSAFLDQFVAQACRIGIRPGSRQVRSENHAGADVSEARSSCCHCSMLRLTIRQITSESRFWSVNSAGFTTSVRTSERRAEHRHSFQRKSTSSSIERLPSCDQIRSCSRRTSSFVGFGDQ